MPNLYTNIVLSVFLVIGVAGCKCRTTPTFHNMPDPSPELRNVENTLEHTQETITESTSIIEDRVGDVSHSTQSIRIFLPDVNDIIRPQINTELNNIDSYIDEILAQTLVIRNLNTELGQAQIQLQVAEDKVETIGDNYKEVVEENETIANERDEAIAAKNSATQKMLRWLIVACVAGSGISIALMFYGNMAIGGMLLAGCSATATIAIAVDKYFDYIAITGLSILGLVVLYVIYTLFVKQKSLDEVVKTAEVAKRRLPVSERRKLFGYREEPGLAEMSIQSAGTIKQVDRVRRRLKKRWDHISDDEAAREMDKYERALRDGEAHVIVEE